MVLGGDQADSQALKELCHLAELINLTCIRTPLCLSAIFLCPFEKRLNNVTGYTPRHPSVCLLSYTFRF